jgi:hypothetical protein
MYHVKSISMPRIRGGGCKYGKVKVCFAAALLIALGGCAAGPVTPPETPPVEPPAEATASETSTEARDAAPEKTSAGGAQSEDPNQAAAETEGEPETPADVQEVGQQASGATTYGLEAEEEKGFEPMDAGSAEPLTTETDAVAGLPPPPGSGETQQEAVARLDRTLNSSLSEFDETLLGDQEALQARIEEGGGSASRGGGGPEEGEFGGSGSYGRDGVGGDDEERTGRGGGGSSEREGSRDGEEAMQSTGSQGGIARTHDPSGQTVPREDIPDGQDDDIVARQLREAAEQETDPELKERLWEEYRKYKEGSSRRADSS